MAAKLKHQNNNPGNVAEMPTRCTASGCNKKSDRMNFCDEHYDWFKFGLINKQGQKPTDFDKKFMAYKKHHKSAA